MTTRTETVFEIADLRYASVACGRCNAVVTLDLAEDTKYAGHRCAHNAGRGVDLLARSRHGRVDSADLRYILIFVIGSWVKHGFEA